MKRFGALVLSVALGAGTFAFAAPQYRWQDRDQDRENDRWERNGNRRHQQLYDEGYRVGQRDGRDGRRDAPVPRFGNAADRKSWERGYEDGFRAARNHGGWGWGNGRPNGGYGNGGYGNGNGGYGNGGYNNTANQARQVGYNDGMYEGQKDRRTGHSFRPTESEAFKDADHQYSVIGGDRQTYKNAYRDGYQQGYQRGYYGR